MSQVEHLVTLQGPNGGLSKSKAQIIYRNTDVYICNGSRFVYVYSMEKKQVMTTYHFPSDVWHIQLSAGSQQLYVLCARNGLYLLEWDERRRLLLDPSSAVSRGGMTICHIGSNFGLLLDPSLCSFTVVNELLVVVSAQQDKWKITVLRKESINHENPITSVSKDVKFSHGYGINSGDPHPVLISVSLWKEKAISSDVPCNLALEAALFTKLFGIDAAMLDSPMILCGFPDGQVVSFPLNSAALHQPCTAQGSAKLLYHLEQPVVSIGAIRMVPSDLASEQPPMENKACDCLLLVGQKGLIVSMTCGENPDAVSCTYKDYRLPAPVTCTSYSMSGVFCCTSSDLLYVTIPHLEKEAASNMAQATVSSLHHNIPMIAALSHVSSLDDTQLVALSKRGHLMLCKLNQKGSKDEQRGWSSVNAGQKIKELLSGIGSVSERFSALKILSDEKSKSLTKLNQVMSLSQALLSGQRTTRPVTCDIRVSWTQMLQKSYMTACCSLENKSDFVLEHGWTLCVLISTDPITSYSFPVLLLKPGETKEFAFPLNGEDSDRFDFPIRICCSLSYSLKGFANPLQRHTSSSYKHGICIPVQEHVIDILHCLRLNPVAAHCSGLSHTSLKDTVQAIWKSSSGSDQQGAPSTAFFNQGPSYTIHFKASVRVSAMILARALKNEKSGRSLCSVVLHWLLSEVLVKELDVHEVRGVTPDGKEFCLQVQEEPVSDLSSEGSIPAVEVQILSSHLHVVASLHLAVISRFKLLLQQHEPNNECQSPDLDLGKVQQLFSARERLLKEVKNLRERLGVDEDIISSAAAQRLLHIYRDLRDPGLLFI
ncbi:Fanconi anemia core complex-associated protein 100 [Leptodactylus fuscus]|uniref:Fanconi anemia core complex-associated protein 100 n=1 Tax=Leptodactylus fuscus TaxID=238119 RepID=UPI003F4E6AC4